jgi:hypothetical protein
MESSRVMIGGVEHPAIRVETPVGGNISHYFPEEFDGSEYGTLEFDFMLESQPLFMCYGYLHSSRRPGAADLRCEFPFKRAIGLVDTPIQKGVWYHARVSLEGHDAFNPRCFRGISIGLANWRHEEVDDGSKLTYLVANVKLSKARVAGGRLDAECARKMADWRRFVDAFAVDYSDGSALLGAPSGHRFEEPIVLVRDGKALAELRVNESYSEACVMTAALDFQRYVKEMTGVELPINPSTETEGVTKLVLGRACSQVLNVGLEHRDDIRRLAGTDGYAIRRVGNDLRIFGACDKGVLNGLYALLENNTGIIWARPNPDFGTVFSKCDELVLVWGQDVLEVPSSKYRGFGCFGETNQAWMTRNRGNYMTAGGGNNYWAFASAKKYGSPMFWFHGGHNVGTFVKSSHPFSEYPELYSLIRGKRRDSACNLCFTNPQMGKVFADNLLDMARRMPRDVTGIQISLDDTWLWCECDECQKDLVLDDGTRVSRTDPSFASTQFFKVVNVAARALREEFPNYTLHVLAYFQTAEPPKCAIESNVVANFAPYPRANDKNPIFAEENHVWLERLKRWRDKTPNLTAYGYNCLGMHFPRPRAHTLKLDFAEFYKHVQGVLSEGTNLEWGDDLDSNFQQYLVWDYAAIELWVQQRLTWDVSQDVETLYKTFCYRAFRDAGPEMHRFYGAIREEWFKDPGASTIGSSPVAMTRKLIIDTGREEELRGYLQQALAKTTHPNSKILIERIQSRFEFFLDETKK